MKFAALISGGKDSTFNLLECLNQGHELVALINLYPPPTSGKDELDSYMYQSVGHEAIDYLALAIGDVPLYKQVISGTAISTELKYSSCNGYDNNDEVEDLFQILSIVKNDFPDLKAISSGAILSNYQRTRVENICERLGLISMAFMWQRSQVELLHSMLRCQMEPILIKIAALGLDEHKHLGRPLRCISNDILKKSAEFGLNPCGEGGEYETLTLDAPFFQKRIEIISSRVITLTEDEYAPVKYLKIAEMKLQDKSSDLYRSHKEIYGSEFCQNLHLQSRTDLSSIDSDLREELGEIYDQFDKSLETVRNESISSILHILTCKSKLDKIENSSEKALIESVNDTLGKMKTLLAEKGFTKDQIVYSVFCVPDMNQFGSVNNIYTKFFNRDNLPARTCIETIENAVVLHCYINVDDKHNTRSNMHIQSFSHWAPASIGPYSQAVSVSPDLCLVSGQIAMHPEDLTLIDGDFMQECLLSLRHVTRVAWVHGCMIWDHLANMICYCIEPDNMITSQTVFHSVICNRSYRCLCNRVCWVTVSALPKAANVEWQAIFSSNTILSNSCYADTNCENTIILSTSSDMMSPNHDRALIHINAYLESNVVIKSGSIQIKF